MPLKTWLELCVTWYHHLNSFRDVFSWFTLITRYPGFLSVDSENSPLFFKLRIVRVHVFRHL